MARGAAARVNIAGAAAFAPAGAIAPAGPDFEAAGPDFEAAQTSQRLPGLTCQGFEAVKSEVGQSL